MPSDSVQVNETIEKLNLEKYALELETNGLTIVPPEVTGFAKPQIEKCVEVLCGRFKEMTGGCDITVEDGPTGELTWPVKDFGKQANGDPVPAPTQMLIQQLLQLDRCFRDLFVNPVVDALIGYLFGYSSKLGFRPWRFSSTNSFVKWQGDFGYGPHLGLHCDQGANPLPWGHTALTANATWCLTEYTKEAGALAYVPGSHKSNAHPNYPFAHNQAVAAEGPVGSVIVWPGSTWHGAFPKQTSGLRLNAVAYYRHHSVLPQENMKVTMREEPWDDCDDPETMKSLIGFEDRFPYESQTEMIPKLAVVA